MKDPYQTLGVAKTASQDEIKKAYRTLAKKLHPDLNPGNKTAEAKFKEVSVAYDQIGTPEARTKFDRGETEEQQQEQARRSYYQTQQEGGRYSQSFGEGMDEEDFFTNLFRSARAQGGGGGRFRNQGVDFPGEDHLYQMDVDFKDAALGAEREITLPTGKKLSVKIPAGIESGTKLRFKNQGGPGVGKGPAGHAFVQVNVRPLAGFKREGNTIETEIPISFQEGLLGGEIKAPTLDGHVMLKIPAGSSTGTRLRIRGKGAGAGDSRGDQIVVLKVVLPKKVDPELQSLLRTWGDKYKYNPRSEL